MKYITEFELRQKYKQELFTDIVIPNETRLTPEAYQFLVDRRIQIVYQDGRTGSLPKKTETLDDKSLTKEANILASEPVLGVQLEEVANQIFILQHEAYKNMNTELSKEMQCLQDSVSMLEQALAGDESVIGPLQLAVESSVIEESTFSITQFSFETIHAALVGRLNTLRLSLKRMAVTLPERSAYYDECKTFIGCCVLKIEQIIRTLGGDNIELSDN